MEKKKKYLKEFILLIIVALIASSVIGYFRSAHVQSKKLTLLKDANTIFNKNVYGLLESKKPLVLIFWGTWCPICKQELNTIDKLAKRQDIILLTIAVNSGTNEDIKRFLKKHKVNFFVINDSSGSLAKSFKIEIFPTVIYYSKDRKKVIKDSGYTSYLGFLARIKLVESNNAK